MVGISLTGKEEGKGPQEEGNLFSEGLGQATLHVGEHITSIIP